MKFAPLTLASSVLSPPADRDAVGAAVHGGQPLSSLAVDFAPFFVKPASDEGALEANSNGATDVAPSGEAMNRRKRRGVESAPSEPPECATSSPDPGLPRRSRRRSSVDIAA